MTLLLDAVITQVVPKDTDLSAVVEVSRERVQLSNGGHESRPVFGGVYVVGLPFGTGGLPVIAPIDLQSGDKLRVTADPQERFVWDIVRKGKVVWTNDNLQEEELAKAETKQAAREATKAAR